MSMEPFDLVDPDRDEEVLPNCVLRTQTEAPHLGSQRFENFFEIEVSHPCNWLSHSHGGYF